MSDTAANPPGPNGAAAPEIGATTGALPPLYRRLEPLVAQRHAGLRIRDAGFGFAREASAVPLAAEEFVVAARSLPIVFSAQPPHMPVAVTGLAAGHSLYVEADGRWRRGAYILAYLRRFPFLLVRTAPGSDQLALCFDPGAPQFSEAEGERLLDDAGQATPALDRALAFCRGVEEAALRTRAMTDALAELGLLKPAVVQFDQGGGAAQPLRVDGFWAVDRPALMALPAEKLTELRDRGWLEAVYAHLVSIAGLSDLARDQGAARAAA